LDDREKPWFGPEEAKKSKSKILAQSGLSQYTPGCADTFTRLSGSLVPNVTSVLTTGVAWTDASYT
jgi:hypothetical protein